MVSLSKYKKHRITVNESESERHKRDIVNATDE